MKCQALFSHKIQSRFCLSAAVTDNLRVEPGLLSTALENKQYTNIFFGLKTIHFYIKLHVHVFLPQKFGQQAKANSQLRTDSPE